MAFKLVNAASIALLVLATLIATGAANFNNENGHFNDLACKNSKNPMEAMKVATKDILKITKNARINLNADKYSKTAKQCTNAYKNAEFEINQVKEILESKDLRALRAYISAASSHYTKCGDVIAQQNESGIMASKNEELVKHMNVLSGLSSGKSCKVV